MSDVILFDLDGTLTDSAEGITKCVQYALLHFGIRVSDPICGTASDGTVYGVCEFLQRTGRTGRGVLP